MEIGKEKAVIVPVSTLGLLLAMVGSADWKTENNERVIFNTAASIDNVDARNELMAYAMTFKALERQACGADVEGLVDRIREDFGDKMLEKVLKKIEEIEKN